MSRYSLTVSGDTAAQLIAHLVDVVTVLHPPAVPAAEPVTVEGTCEVVAPKRKRGRPPNPPVTQAVAEAVENHDETVEKDPETAEAVEPDAIGFATATDNVDALREELRGVLSKLHGFKGLNYVVRVLQQYNADRVSSVKPELLTKAIAEAHQYLAAK